MEALNGVVTLTGATVDGVQTTAEVLMQRQGVDKWPTSAVALNQWRQHIADMDTRDVQVPIKEIMIDANSGGIFRHGKPASNALPVTHTALGHLVSYVKEKPESAVSNLAFYPPLIRTNMWEYLKEKTPARNVNLRTALTINDENPRRVVRAVVSDIHSQKYGDDLQVIDSLEKLGNQLAGAKLRVIRTWDDTTVELVVPNKAVQLKPGVIAQGRLYLYNSETKGGSFEAWAGCMNLCCINGLMADGNKTTVKIRHMGDISYKLGMGVKTVFEALDENLHQMKAAYSAKLSQPRASYLEAIAKKYALPEETVTAMATLWDVDGERSAGDTLAGLVNALTRHAQSLPMDKAAVEEAVAGKVLAAGLDALL